VVGSSAAGLFAAYLLASKGQAVGVYEQAEELNPRARTLIVTHRVRELLGSLGESAIVNEIRRFELFADGRVVTISLDRPDLILERAKLINLLAAHAQGAGMQLHLGRRFLGIQEDRGRLAMRLGSNNGNGGNRGGPCPHGHRRRRGNQQGRPGWRLAAAGNGATAPSECDPSVRSPLRHRTGMVCAGAYAVLLLVDP